MAHPALEIENWSIVDSTFELSNPSKPPVGYLDLEVDATNFYFYLKEKFGLPNYDFDLVSVYFPEQLLGRKKWCYLFSIENYYVIVCGEDLVNIVVFYLNEPPTPVDFELFRIKCNERIENVSLKSNDKYRLYINYHFYLKNLIQEFKNSLQNESIKAPAVPSIESTDDLNDPVVKFKFYTASKDFNQWTEAVLKRSSSTLNILILLPIYLESLIDLAFRIKLKKSSFEKKTPNEKDTSWAMNIFDQFERKNLEDKLNFIKTFRFDVNEEKLDQFKSELNAARTRNDRNKLLHGNVSFFENLNYNFYVDNDYIIGMPDRAMGIKLIVESIQNTIANKKILVTIGKYEKLSSNFCEIFDDKGYFKSVVSGVVFCHNSISGGAIGFPFLKLENLFAPSL